jgi:SAM-dependent methyltransferase
MRQASKAVAMRFPAPSTPLIRPSARAKNRLSYRRFAGALTYAADRYAHGCLVDIGCGRKRWEPIFAPHVTSHIGVDHVQKMYEGHERVDVIATAYEVPLDDGSADTVLMTEVLEHLEDPRRGLAEGRRLLAPGGHLIATSPLFWPVHDRRDFFRYTPQAWRYLLGETGFEVVEIVPLGGAWSTISLEFSYALERYRRSLLAPIVDALCIAAQTLAVAWERVDFQPNFSWNHLAIGRARVD